MIKAVLLKTETIIMSTSNKICNDGASKLNDDGVCEMNDMLHNMSTAADDNNNVPVCANCGKEGSDITNTCNKCNSVMYCNAACKKKHRHKHKKDCERRVAELHDEKLFKQPPLQFDDCPICFLRLPALHSGWRYKTCCGKQICSGCIHAVRTRDGNIGLCPFCRTPAPTSDKEDTDRLKGKAEVGDAIAISMMGNYYLEGMRGFPRDTAKALELWHKAGELGYASAHHNMGVAYNIGKGGVQVDKKKGKHYYELAAMGGDVSARHNLGYIEGKAGNVDRAIKHCLIAAGCGQNNSLQRIQRLYSNGDTTKENYTVALQGYQEYLGEIKSDQRDEAAAFMDGYKYIEN